MTAREAFGALEQFLVANPPLELATVAKPAKPGQQHEARFLPLEGKAQAFFRHVTAEAVIGQAEQAELRPLDLTYKPEPNTIEWALLSDINAVRVACERYESFNDLASFAPRDEAYKRRLLFWVASRSHGGERAFFFRAFSASSELKRKRGAALVSRDGPFHLVEEQIFLFDEHVDCVAYQEYVFVLRKTDYRRIFDQLEQVRQAARRAAVRLNQMVPIANFTAFAEACEAQPAMADKLIAVESRDYFGTLSYEMLKPVIAEFALDIAVETRNGSPHLIFKSEPAHRWRILRLVDDDFLKSSMTNHRYEVNSKTET